MSLNFTIQRFYLHQAKALSFKYPYLRFSNVFQQKERVSSTPTIKRRIQTSLQVSVYLQKEVTTPY